MGNRQDGRRPGKIRSWLIEIRKAQDLTQGAVAAAAGISQPSYCEIENGTSAPKVETAKRIGATLDFPWCRFFEDDEDSSAEDADAAPEGTD